MKHTYQITGITCQSCVAFVKSHLLNLKDVTNVQIDILKKEVTLKTNAPISIKILQASLPLKYILQENLTASPLKNKWKTLFPLWIILIYLLISSNLIHYQNWNFKAVSLSFMGLFYVVFSFFKLLDIKGFSVSFQMYDPLAKKYSFYGMLYPFIEIILALMLLLKFEIIWALTISLISLSITTLGILKTLVNKKQIQCACLGTLLKLPMTEATLIENGLMIAMASSMLVKIVS